MEHRSVLRHVASTLGVLALAACSGGAHTSGPPPTTAAHGGIIGTYLADFTSADQYGPAGHQISVGDWVLGGPSQGSASLKISPTQVVVSSQGGTHDNHLGTTFSFTDGTFTIGGSMDGPCPDAYPAGATTGTYTYSLHAGTLVVHVVQDSCLERAGTLTLHPWHRQ